MPRASKPTLSLRIHEALAPFGFPRAPGPGMGFTPEDDACFARGYPRMRFVDDLPDAPKKRVAAAEKALDAIDPVLRIRVPRDFAAAYLRGYRVGPLLFVDRNHPAGNGEKRLQRAAAMAAGDPITEALLRETLEVGGHGMGFDTYGGWRFHEVLFLYENFIGSEAVARILVDHLVHLGTDLATWGFAGTDPFRWNAVGHHLALALPWILLRVDPGLAVELRARLGAVARKTLGEIQPTAYYDLLQAIAHPEVEQYPPTVRVHRVPLSLAHGHVATLREVMATVSSLRDATSEPGRMAWVLGSEVFAGALGLSGWGMMWAFDSMAPLRDPGVVRAMAHLGKGRAMAQEVARWLQVHAAYARPVLERLAKVDDPKEAAIAEKALGYLGGEAPAAAPPSEDALEAEIAAIFAKLGAALRRSNDREAMVAHIREAHEAYVEARAAVGDPTPEAYFTHRFGDFGLGAWAMLAVDAL